MSDPTGGATRRLDEQTLLDLLEDPGDPELAGARDHLAASPADRRALAELMAVEGALLEGPWARAEAQVAQEEGEALPAALQARLLAMTGAAPAEAPGEPATAPAGAASALKAGRPAAGDAPRPPLASMRWHRRMMVAALALIAVGAGRLFVGGETDTRMRGTDAVDVATVEAPFVLITRLAGADDTHTPPLDAEGEGGWQVSVPADATVQLRVRPEPGLSGRQRFGASLSLYMVTDVGRRLLLEEPFTAEGSGSDPDVALGPPVNLNGLRQRGAAPGDRLEMVVQRQGQTYTLAVVLDEPMR